MSHSLLMLKVEHENFAKLLGVLDDQIRIAGSDGEPDMEIIGLVSEYFSGYPAECHHPKEDVLYRKLKTKGALEGRGVSDLMREHEQIADITRCFADLAKRASDAGGTATELLDRVIPRFVAMYRDHIAREEQYFLSAAEEFLTPEDFSEIEYDFFDRKDPIFHHEAEARYKQLRDEIYRLAEQGARPAARDSASLSDEELAFLQGLSSVAAFNVALKTRDIKLVEIESGGYALEHDGRAVVEIPQCSEARAAWCAYFYLRGKTGLAAFNA